MDKAPNSRTYIPGLDGIRAIAFLLVFWAHALPPVSYYIPATLGVTIFFFLSGYLITTLLRREFESTGTIALGDFYLRRALRIFVPLWVVYACVAAFAHFIEHDSAGNLAGLCSALFYYYNYSLILGFHTWPPLGLNVIWSLCVEEHFYLLFPLVYLWLVRRRTPRRTQTRVLVAFCLLELAWRFILVQFLGDNSLWTYYATDARLDSILWGSILALTHNPVFFAQHLPPPRPRKGHPTPHNCHPESKQGPRGAFFAHCGVNDGSASPATDPPFLPARFQVPAFLLALVLLAVTLIPRSFLYRETLRYTLQALALYLIFSFVIPNIAHPAVRWLEWRPLRYLGWISYVLYLCHDCILDVLTRYWPDRFFLTGPAAFLVAVGFATLLRYTLELPLQRLRARLRPAPPMPRSPQQSSGFL